jgi:hypothetical protein
MSTEPTPGQNEHGHTSDHHPAASAAEVDATTNATNATSAVKAAEASKLFDKLFASSESTTTTTSTTPAKKSLDIPPPVVKKVETGETFTRKLVDETEEHSFQRVATIHSDSPVELPERFVGTTQEATIPPPLRKIVETSPVKAPLKTQDIPTAVDAVVSEQVKAQILEKVKAAKHAAKPELNFPERINNLKTQHDTLRARLASLE